MSLFLKPSRWMESLHAWTASHRRSVVAGVILLGLVIGSVAGWQGMTAWQASQAEAMRRGFDDRALAVAEDLNAEVDAWNKRLHAEEAPPQMAEALEAMTAKIAALEIEAASLRRRLADLEPWSQRARDALANAQFRIESLRERAQSQAEELAARREKEQALVTVSKPVAPGTALMIATPEQLARAREIGKAYHQRQLRRFAGQPLTWLPSSHGSLVP